VYVCFGFILVQNVTGSERAEKLLQSLLQCKDKRFPAFRRALTDTNQQHIVDQYLSLSDCKMPMKLQFSPRERFMGVVV